MRWLVLRQRLMTALLRRHGPVKGFEEELTAAGGLAGRFDAGIRIVPAEKIVGSVGRSHNLRSDFFYRTGQAMTDRFHRVGRAMQKGVVLPPLELYKLKGRRQRGERSEAVSEYYVVDGHHRVAMARKLGQDFLDAHVVEYRVEGTPPAVAHPPAGAEGAQPTPPAAETEHLPA